jgi:hypothetical protein
MGRRNTTDNEDDDRYNTQGGSMMSGTQRKSRLLRCNTVNLVSSPEEFFCMQTPPISAHEPQFLRQYAMDIYCNVVRWRELRELHMEDKDGSYYKELIDSRPNQAAAEENIRRVRAAMSPEEALRWIDNAMPHMPVLVREHMVEPGSVLFVKYFAAKGNTKVRPDFTTVQLMYMTFWQLGSVASNKQLRDSVSQHFPYYKKTSFRSVDDKPKDPIGTKITRVLQENFRYQERLFQPVSMYENDLQPTLYRAVPGYEALIFPCIGIPDTRYTSTQVRYDKHPATLPTEIILKILEEYFDYQSSHLTARGVVFGSHTELYCKEPLLSYPQRIRHSNYQVCMPELGKLLAPSLVCRQWRGVVLKLLFKKHVFDLTAGYSWLRGVHPNILEKIEKVHLNLYFTHFKCVRDRNIILLNMIETGCTLCILELRIEAKMLYEHQRQAMKRNFRHQPEIHFLSQLRGVTSTIEFGYLGCDFIPVDEDSKPLMDDDLRWLEQQMALPKASTASAASREDVLTGMQSTEALRQDSIPSTFQELSEEEEPLGNLQNLNDLPQKETTTDVQAVSKKNKPLRRIKNLRHNEASIDVQVVAEKEQPLRRSRRIEELRQNEASTGVQECSEEKQPTRCSKRIKELREKSEDVSKPKSTPKRKNASGGGGGVRKRAKKG